MKDLVKLNENTLFPASIVFAFLSIFGGSCWWMSALYTRVAQAENNISDLQESQGKIIEELKGVNFNLVEIKTVLKTTRSVRNGR